jgi:hypothetical protein
MTSIAQIVVVVSLLSGGLMSQTNVSTIPATGEGKHDLQISLPGSPFGIASSFLYGYEGVKAFEFMPQLRQLGSDFTKIYLFWNQVEPEKGRYDWTAVDKFVDQLNSPDEGLIAVFSTSQWAVQRPAIQLPPSPAKNPDDYYRFIHDLVKHCKGRVRYWQNDAEPNSPIYWSGTKEEFVAQLKIFYTAVKDADPAAVVVVGGYDGLFGPPGTHQFPNQQVGLDFFDYVLKEGRNAFDLFDLRLYGDPYTIVSRVEFMRQKMLALGYDKPIISTEYGGPNLFEFPENRKYVPLVASWMQSMNQTGAADTPAMNPIEDLYKNMASLAPETQMFMQGCPPELDAKYQRLQARGIVVRNLFALAAGVQKTMYWYLPAFPVEGSGRYNMMVLMYGKIGMLEFRDGALGKRNLTAEAFERMAKAFAGVQQVKHIEVPDRPSIFLFEVDRGKRGPVYVVWERRDLLSGEDSPAVPFEWTIDAKKASAIDTFGHAVPVQISDGHLHVEVSVTPIFVELSR